MTLPERIASFIEKVQQEVSYETIRERSVQAGYSAQDIQQALGTVHKTVGIKVRQADGTLYYRFEIPKPRQAPPPSRYEPTKEEVQEWNELQDNFYQHSPLVSDAERTAYIEKHKYRTCTCIACEATKIMFMSKIELKNLERKIERDALV